MQGRNENVEVDFWTYQGRKLRIKIFGQVGVIAVEDKMQVQACEEKMCRCSN